MGSARNLWRGFVLGNGMYPKMAFSGICDRLNANGELEYQCKAEVDVVLRTFPRESLNVRGGPFRLP